MTLFTSFAVAGGSGRLGGHIVASLIANGAKTVKVLSRSVDTAVPTGAEACTVKYSSVEALIAVLGGVEVLISTVGGPYGREGSNLAEAAKAAGVKLYVPNEFGASTEGVAVDSPLGYKVATRALSAQLGLPTLILNCGLFPETTFGLHYLGFNFPAGKVSVVGSLDTPYSITSPRDVGSYLGTLLTQMDSEEILELGTVAIEGERVTFGEVIRTYERLHSGRKIEVKRTSIEDGERELESLEGMQRFARWLAIKWAKGGGDSTAGGTVKLAHGLVPVWAPSSSVAEFLATV